MPSDLSTELASAAARLIVEEGMEYGPAKRRAARDLGKRSTRQVDQPAELRALREVALLWMERLQEFRPHLYGAVWRGTATRLNSVRLELFCDDSKQAELALIDRRVDYDVGSLDGPRGEQIDVLTVSSPSAALGEEVTVHLTILDRDDLRGALKPDSRGRSERGDLAGLRRLLASDEGAA